VISARPLSTLSMLSLSFTSKSHTASRAPSTRTSSEYVRVRVVATVPPLPVSGGRMARRLTLLLPRLRRPRLLLLEGRRHEFCSQSSPCCPLCTTFPHACIALHTIMLTCPERMLVILRVCNRQLAPRRIRTHCSSLCDVQGTRKFIRPDTNRMYYTKHYSELETVRSRVHSKQRLESKLQRAENDTTSK